jgi:hypothetical protein
MRPARFFLLHRFPGFSASGGKMSRYCHAITLRNPPQAASLWRVLSIINLVEALVVGAHYICVSFPTVAHFASKSRQIPFDGCALSFSGNSASAAGILSVQHNN